MPRLCECNPGICLTTEEKARENLSQGSRRVLVYILIYILLVRIFMLLIELYFETFVLKVHDYGSVADHF